MVTESSARNVAKSVKEKPPRSDASATARSVTVTDVTTTKTRTIAPPLKATETARADAKGPKVKVMTQVTLNSIVEPRSVTTNVAKSPGTTRLGPVAIGDQAPVIIRMRTATRRSRRRKTRRRSDAEAEAAAAAAAQVTGPSGVRERSNPAKPAARPPSSSNSVTPATTASAAAVRQK